MSGMPANQGPVIDGIDQAGWSREWRSRLRKATNGLSVPQNTPRGRSERRFLAQLGQYPEGVSFRTLCDRSATPCPAGWTVDQWVRDLLFDLKRVGSVEYRPEVRRWFLTGRGALVADPEAEWVVGPPHASSKEEVADVV
jgi:hypothetical protein